MDNSVTTKGIRSLGTMLAEADMRPSGFEYMRFLLSIAVVVSHTINVCYGMEITIALWNNGLGFILKPILPMFFLLSGFLVAGSLYRCRTLISFMLLRGIRIYPALTVEVLLSALLIGPLVTTVSWSEYFSDPLFFRYLVNATGHISYDLPGVFLDNPTPRIVNQQLWTVPYELYCYIALGLIALFGLRQRPSIIFPVTVMLAALIAWRDFQRTGEIFQVNHMLVNGRMLVLYFLVGVGVNLYKDRIPASLPLFLACLVVSPFLLFFAPGGDYWAILPVAYVTCWLGVSNFRRLGILRFADCSYGVFLYGYVIQQTLVFVFPETRIWYVNALLAVPLSILVGLISWKLIEEPVMKRKKIAKVIEDEVTAFMLAVRGPRKS